MTRRRLLIALMVAACAIAAITAPASAQVFRFGVDGTKVDHKTPTEVPGTSEVAEPDASNGNICMRTASGRVVTQGSNSDGSLGDGGAVAQSESAVEAELPPEVFVTSVGEAEFACAAVTSTGELYVWGSNTLGEICMGESQETYFTPVKVPGVTEAVSVQGAAKHLLIRLASGRVEVCGHTGLGLGKSITQVYSPTLIPNLEHVVQVSAGAGTSGARTESGEIYMWGNNRKGEVGDGNTKAAMSPVHISLPKPAVDLSVGGNSDNGHTEVLLTENVVYGWGEDEAGEIGDGSEAKKLSPALATKFSSVADITSVVASGTITMVLTEPGDVYSVGSGKYLGTMEAKSSFTPVLIAEETEEISGTAYNQVLRKA